MRPESNADDLIYLDYNATTPVSAEVVAAMLPYWGEVYGNPSSTHRQGRLAHAAIELARAQLARLVGVAPDWIIFTGGATEANNLALLGAARKIPLERRHIVISAVEHPAVAEPARELARQGWTLSVAPVDECGRVKMDEFERLLRPDTGLVSVMHANNETGTIQAIDEIARLTKPRGIVLHTDAAQSVGKVRVNLPELGADMLVVAGHKFYAPKGVGALVRDPSIGLAPIVFGAGHEHGLRPGTENLALIVALGEAARLADASGAQRTAYLLAMRDRLHAQLLAAIPGLLLNGHETHRLPNTLNVSLPGCEARTVLASLADAVAASAGSACHSDADAVSGVLGAMGIGAQRAAGAIRFSVGVETSAHDVDRAAAQVAEAWTRFRKSQ
jgi:cysteine desulfurase